VGDRPDRHVDHVCDLAPLLAATTDRPWTMITGREEFELEPVGSVVWYATLGNDDEARAFRVVGHTSVACPRLAERPGRVPYLPAILIVSLEKAGK